MVVSERSEARARRGCGCGCDETMDVILKVAVLNGRDHICRCALWSLTPSLGRFRCP